MFNEYLISEMARMQHEQRLEEARLARILGEVRTGKPSFRDRVLLSSGEIMMNLGQKLKERYDPMIKTRLTLQHPRLK